MTPRPHDATVWVVDDSPSHAEHCRRALCSSFEVVVFHEAGMVLERLSTSRAPDAIVADWHMPDVSGIDVVIAIRTQFPSAVLPLVIVTSERSKDEALRALRAGANDFVMKPYSAEELLTRVEALVRANRLLAELRAARAQLEEEAEFRERVMAVLAHDLRQPLHQLTLGIELLGGTLEAEKRARTKARLLGASLRMNRMVEQLLDMARARDGGTFSVHRREFRLSEAVLRIVGEVEGATPGHTLHVAVSGDSLGSWDEDRIGQVVSNLIGNAVTHGARGGAIEISVEVKAEHVALTVANAGKPIDPARLESLFEPFRKGASSSGLGLGLYIVKAIVESHGGSVRVRSDDARTSFEVLLPRASGGATSRGPEATHLSDEGSSAR